MLKICQIKISVVSKTTEIKNKNYFSVHSISHPTSDTVYMIRQVDLISKECVTTIIR